MGSDGEKLAGFDDYLRDRGLSANTRRSYLNVAIQAGQEPEATLRWYTGLLAKRAPIGTVQQARSALARWYTYLKQPEHIVALPPARGKQREHRQGLTDGQLGLYLSEADKQKEPARTILALLPRTGLRISEICQLRLDQVKSTEEVHYFSFRGKGDKPRVVPLGAEGLAVLRAYLDWRAKRKALAASPFLFPGRGGSHYRPNTIRRVCADIQQGCPDLDGLSPHVLRHTYATRAVVNGVDLARLQKLLGHGSIRTTERYLHPTVQDLSAAVTKVAGL